MALNEDIFGGNSEPRRERGGAGSEHFDTRLALASHHLRVKDFPENGRRIMI